MAKNARAAVSALVSSGVAIWVSVIALRPASAPASQACWRRVLTTYSRAMSTAEPAKPISGTSAAAMIAIVLPRASRASRRMKLQ